MEKLITPDVETQLKQKFAEELKGEVDVKIFTKSPLMVTDEQQKQFIEFATQFMDELTAIEPRIKVERFDFDSEIAKTLGLSTSPTILVGYDKGYRIIYNGSPSGYEIGGFIEVIAMVSGGDSLLPEEIVNIIKQAAPKLDRIQVFVTPTCPYCPRAVVGAHQIAIASGGKVISECVESYENQEAAQSFGVSSVPHTIINNDVNKSIIGALPEISYVKAIVNFVAPDIIPEHDRLSDAPSGVIALTDANFKQALAKHPNLVVDFWAEWCMPCKVMAPQYEELSEQYAGKVVFGSVNVDENQQISSLYEVMSIPTLVMYKNGKR